jgi:hypothetical protein
MARITLNIEAEDAADLRLTLQELAQTSTVRQMVEDGEVDVRAQAWGDYIPLTVDEASFLRDEPDAGARQDAEPGERQRIRRTADEKARGLTVEQAIAERSARAAAPLNPTPASATDALIVFREETSGQPVQDEPLSAGEPERPTTAQPDEARPLAPDPLSIEAAAPAFGPTMVMDDGSLDTGDATLDDDADAEGLSGVSEAQDRLDREYAETMREGRPTNGSAKPAASAQDGQSAPTATDASPEPEAAPGASPALPGLDLDEPADPVVDFINTVGKCGTWAEGVSALAALTKSHPLKPHELRGARVALWNIPARTKDKADPASHPTNFLCWLEVADEVDQVDGTLGVLERSDVWARYKPEQHEKIRAAAAQAKRRIEDKRAEMS